MFKLRKKGYSYADISLELKISYNTVLYHLNESFRNKRKEIGRQKRNTKEYQRNYQRKRYNEDAEFRKKQLKRVKESNKKKNE